MADNKKYVEVINNGTTDYHVRDAEAQAAIATLDSAKASKPTYVAATQSLKFD